MNNWNVNVGEWSAFYYRSLAYFHHSHVRERCVSAVVGVTSVENNGGRWWKR